MDQDPHSYCNIVKAANVTIEAWRCSMGPKGGRIHSSASSRFSLKDREVPL